MPKTLVIIRHGKSSWEYQNTSDVDRPLKESGISNTGLIAQKLNELNITPDLILTSHANRALHTAQIIARHTGYPETEISILPVFYHCEASEILDRIKTTGSEINTLFIFGHNPTFTNLANIFLIKPIIELPTSGTVILTFACKQWKDISPNCLESEITLFPKLLNSK